MEVFGENDIDIFAEPARIMISGTSGAGKTTLLCKLVLAYEFKFDIILVCGSKNHQLENIKEIKDKLFIREEITNPFDYKINENTSILYVLDDCFEQANKSEIVSKVFTAGRHKKCSTIFLVQNLMGNGPQRRTISLNCTHFIFLRQRDIRQIQYIAREIYGKKLAEEFANNYKEIITGNPHSYVLVDLSNTTPEPLRIRGNLFGEQGIPYQIIYQWNAERNY